VNWIGNPYREVLILDRPKEGPDITTSALEDDTRGGYFRGCGLSCFFQYYGLLVSSYSPVQSGTDLRSRLLLGVDSEQKHIACGLVDTIGMSISLHASSWYSDEPFYRKLYVRQDTGIQSQAEYPEGSHRYPS
jgi:hypothetical protein